MWLCKLITTAIGLVAAFWIPSVAAALQAPNSSPYKRFDILILPEYEHPGVEIRVEGEVKPGHYPRYLEMEVPADTRVALLSKRSQQGGPVSERIATREQDGRTYLPLDISEAQFFIRYFFNPFENERPDRTFSFELTTNEVLPEFYITIQRPVAARNFRHSLAEADEQEGEFGLIYYRQHVHGLQPGKSCSVTVSYDNPSNTFTVPALRARIERLPAGDGNARPATGGRPSNLTVVLLASALVCVGVFIIFRKWGRQKAATNADLREIPGIAPVKKGSSKAPEGEKFCAGCGTPRRPGDRFCSSCGKEF